MKSITDLKKVAIKASIDGESAYVPISGLLLLNLLLSLEKYEEALEQHTYTHYQLEYECDCWACETLTQVQKIMEMK